MQENNTEKDEKHVYANKINGETIHISEATSGRGYFCLGCDRGMQAVKSAIKNRASYFRHDAEAVKNQPKCTYSDETHRHKIAKTFLQLSKRIKVPAVYKYPPKGSSGLATLLQPAKYIEAATVKVERTFYEDTNGEIKHGSNVKIPEKHLLIKPDVTFFDKNDNPILFIEIVATHKITDEKRVRLKRLGIDTIQVIIPKDSPEAIENIFKITDKTQWVYNYEEQCKEYVPTPTSSTEGILSGDELQRKLFEESYDCRAAQIKQLIRTINLCLESQPYIDAEQRSRDELSRVKANTERSRERMSELQNQHRENIQRELSGDFTDAGFRREELNNEQIKFQLYKNDLGERYLRKRKQIEDKGRITESEITKQIETYGRGGENFGFRRGKIEFERERIENEYSREANPIDQNIERERELFGDIQRKGETLQERFRELREKSTIKFKNDNEYENREIDRIQERREQLPQRFENEGIELEKEYRRKELQLEKEFGGEEKLIINTIKNEDIAGDSELSGRIKAILSLGKRLTNISEAQFSYNRARKIWECFKSGAYKDWR